MILDIDNLPSDVTILHQIIAELATEVMALKKQLILLRAKKYGASSEKRQKELEEAIDQKLEEIELCVEEVEGLTNIVKEDPEPQKPKRKPLPDNLPRDEIVLEPDPVCPACGSDKFRKISDDVSEVLDYKPASFRVKRYVRPRCACVSCDQIVQAYPPSKTIDKGKASPGLLAHIIVQKYGNHLPLYRQSQIYEREGIELSRSTMAHWVGQTSRLLEPLIAEIRSYVFASSHLHGDDTPVKVLSPGYDKTKVGRIWVYVKDGRPYGDTDPPAVCYFYSPDRKGERPAKHLTDFKGVFHADAYAGYDQLYKTPENPDGDIIEAACWAHGRRKFYDIIVTHPKATVATYVLNRMGEIYAIEAEINGLPAPEKLKVRQEKSKSLVDSLFTDMRKFFEKVPPKSETAKAMTYMFNHQAAFLRFLDDGKIDIDNNAAERAIRAIALGRKNWLFAGSDFGGEAAAAMYTLIETLKLNHINPWTYLNKVLEIIQDHPINKIHELLPWNLRLSDP